MCCARVLKFVCQASCDMYCFSGRRSHHDRWHGWYPQALELQIGQRGVLTDCLHSLSICLLTCSHSTTISPLNTLADPA